MPTRCWRVRNRFSAIVGSACRSRCNSSLALASGCSSSLCWPRSKCPQTDPASAPRERPRRRFSVGRANFASLPCRRKAFHKTIYVWLGRVDLSVALGYFQRCKTILNRPNSLSNRTGSSEWNVARSAAFRGLVIRAFVRSSSYGVAGGSYFLETLAPTRVFALSLKQGRKHSRTARLPAKLIEHRRGRLTLKPTISDKTADHRAVLLFDSGRLVLLVGPRSGQFDESAIVVNVETEHGEGRRA